MSLDEDENDVFDLISNQKDKIKVEKKILLKSDLLTSIIEGLSDEELKLKEIPLDFSTDELKKVVEFLQLKGDNISLLKIPTPLKYTTENPTFDSYLSEDVRKYVNSLSMKELTNLIKISNNLNIKTMLHILTAKLSSLIKNKSFDEIKQILQK